MEQLKLIPRLRRYTLTDMQIKKIYSAISLEEVKSMLKKPPDQFFKILEETYNIKI